MKRMSWCVFWGSPNHNSSSVKSIMLKGGNKAQDHYSTMHARGFYYCESWKDMYVRQVRNYNTCKEQVVGNLIMDYEESMKE